MGNFLLLPVAANFLLVQLKYFTVTRGLDTEPKLPHDLVAPLYRLLSDSNLHAVHVTRCLLESVDSKLLFAHDRIRRVLEDVAERQWKQHDINEVLSLKAFYFSVIVDAAGKAYKEEADNTDAKDAKEAKPAAAGRLSAFFRNLLKPASRDAVPQGCEQLVRRALREYPYSESNLLQSMMRTLAPIKVGGHPTSLSVLSSGINGQQFFKDQTLCETCHEPEATKDKPAGRDLKRCSACHVAAYCDATCQRMHWFVHKRRCGTMK